MPVFNGKIQSGVKGLILRRFRHKLVQSPCEILRNWKLGRGAPVGLRKVIVSKTRLQSQTGTGACRQAQGQGQTEGLSARRHRTGRAIAAVLAAGVLAGCAVEPGPSVPTKAGSNVFEARQSLAFCAPQGPKGARAAVTSSYIASMIFLGVLPGAIAAASGEEHTRRNGAINAVDDCLTEQGFERRELTAQEAVAIKQRDRYARERLLNHLINGGTLASYDGP